MIDYLFLPVALADRIRTSGTLYNAAKKLQLIRKRGIADHVPVHVVTMYLLQHPSYEADFPDERVTKIEVPKWDYDLLVRALREGYCRSEFVAALETEMQKFIEGDMKQLSAKRTPDDFFQRLDEIIIEVAGRFFSRGSTPEDLHHKTLKEKRMEILHRRRAHRAAMVDSNSDEQFQPLHLELHEMSKECKKARAKIETHRKQRIMDELWDAWKARRFAECHRLLRPTTPETGYS